MKKRKISIVTPTFNEEKNIKELCNRVRLVGLKIKVKYDYEHIVIDNNSYDQTQNILRVLVKQDKKIKCIFNSRNFGYIRSSYYGLLSSDGDAVVLIASDLQDPPEMILDFVKKWESGFDVVMASKSKSNEFFVMKYLRKIYYRILSKISEAPLENDATGAGLYDKKVIDLLRTIKDPYPYFRGLVCDLGFKRTTVNFFQPKRSQGKSSTNFYILFDNALQAMTKHSKVPIRFITIFGFLISFFSLIISAIFLILKIIYWQNFSLGIAPLLISIFFFFGVLFFFIGIIGEYLGMVLTHVRDMPLVVEKERLNFKKIIKVKK